MIDKIKRLILSGFNKFEKEYSCTEKEIQFVLFKKKGKINYWVYRNMKPEKEVTFWQMIDKESSIKFIDYESIAETFIQSRIEGYVRADNIDEDTVFLILRKENESVNIHVYFGEKPEESLMLEELFEQ